MASRRVLIVGAGFAGFALARALDAQLVRLGHVPLQVTLVATSPFAQLSPLLPGIISGWTEPWQVLVPLQPSLHHVAWLPARAVAFDAASHLLTVESPASNGPSHPTTLPYDDLVLAVGSAPALHNVDGAAEHALALASVHDALRLRNRVVDALDAASAEESPRRRRALLTVAVLGNSSLACAAALECAALLRDARHHYPRVRAEDPRVLLVSPSERACADLPPPDAAAVARLLDDVGIEVLSLRAPVRLADRHLVLHTPGGEPELVDTRTVVWAMPGAPAPLFAAHPEWMALHGRLRVDEMLRVVGATDLFALGGCAAPHATSGVPAVDSPPRILAEARALARNLVARAQGRSLEPVKAPLVDALSLDRDWGWVAVGSRRLSGQAAACIARSFALSLAPRWSHRQAVRASWALRRLSGPGVAPRLQPTSPSLFLTGTPPVVAPRADDKPRFPSVQP